jgi:hypothetical protein
MFHGNITIGDVSGRGATGVLIGGTPRVQGTVSIDSSTLVVSGGSCLIAVGGSTLQPTDPPVPLYTGSIDESVYKDGEAWARVTKSGVYTGNYDRVLVDTGPRATVVLRGSVSSELRVVCGARSIVTVEGPGRLDRLVVDGDPRVRVTIESAVMNAVDIVRGDRVVVKIHGKSEALTVTSIPERVAVSVPACAVCDIGPRNVLHIEPDEMCQFKGGAFASVICDYTS